MGETIGEVTREDNNFPKQLLEVHPLVEKLWYRGSWVSTTFNKCVAIVGSRRMSRYGKQVISEIVPKLVVAGYTVVSGLMYGIDQEAHKVTLENGGKCIGVLGWGIDYECEEGARKMEEKIVASDGLVISEYAPGTTSHRWMFPARNRIVAGLSKMVVIVEAAEKSGTMSTAKWAKKFGKELFAVPGNMFSDTSSGSNILIANQEAKLLTMKEVMGWDHSSIPLMRDECGRGAGGELLTLLKIDGPQSVNELSRRLGKGVGEISAQLLQAELVGKVAEERGMWKVV